MHNPSELKLLIATRFTVACFSAIRAVAQLAEVFRLSITIAHVGPANAHTSRELKSFFAEADHYESCRRVQLHGSPVEALAEFARQGKYDLILAPRSDRMVLPRPFHRSLRAELLQSAGVPVWTGANWLEQADFLRPYRTIAVGIDGRDGDLAHLHLAASFAALAGAKLHLLTVVPLIHEGTLLANAVAPQPLSEEVAIERARSLLSDWSQMPEVRVAIGAPEREIPRLAAECGADLLFLPESQSCAGIFRPQISRTVDQSPCGVIAIPASLPENFKWTFQSNPPRGRQATTDRPALRIKPASERLSLEVK
jgi:nucleotide-binding universal stress UspA family protein